MMTTALNLNEMRDTAPISPTPSLATTAETDGQAEDRRLWHLSLRCDYAATLGSGRQLLPMRMPTASTSPPPSITLAIAETGGVSMNRH